MESTFEKIQRKTGTKPVSCKCNICKSQCIKTPCLGSPEDIIKIIDAGYGHRLCYTTWAAGMTEMRITDRTVDMIAPLYDEEKKSCTFFTNGLCELHDLGLKPTEGKLSHHTVTKTNTNPKKSLSWAVAKEWLSIRPSQLLALVKKLKFIPACRVCGCTDEDCRQCIEKTGEPCYWVEEDLCSACASTADINKKSMETLSVFNTAFKKHFIKSLFHNV